MVCGRAHLHFQHKIVFVSTRRFLFLCAIKKITKTIWDTEGIFIYFTKRSYLIREFCMILLTNIWQKWFRADEMRGLEIEKVNWNAQKQIICIWFGCVVCSNGHLFRQNMGILMCRYTLIESNLNNINNRFEMWLHSSMHLCVCVYLCKTTVVNR